MVTLEELMTAEFDYATFKGERVTSFSLDIDNSLDIDKAALDGPVGLIAPAVTTRLVVNGVAVPTSEVRHFTIHLKTP